MRKYILLFTFFIAALQVLQAQKVSLKDFKDMKPRNIGPSGMSGRITAIDVVLKDPNIIYLGAASGGVWKTENSGHSWTPVFEEQPTQNIGSIAIQQSNPNIVWVGTGEGNPRNSLNIGEGIFKSLDAGKTWNRMGLEKTRNIHRVIIDPTDPNIIYAGAIGNPFGIHPERGVFKSTDGGETWQKILYVNDTTGCAELVMDPSNPNKLIASMWQHRRTPYDFTSGGGGSGLYITIDGGKNWKKLEAKDGLPAGPLGRIGIDFAASMPTRVYAKIEATKNGLYSSDDGGFTWKMINNNPGEVTDRPFYYQEIYVDPKNENRIYDIHSTVTVSEDAGKSFNTLLPYFGIHPDHHAWWIHPEDPDFIIDGNDGGIGISRDRGKNWVFDDKIPVGQFYHINVDNEIPYNVMGGMQDNGSWHGPAYTWINGGIRNYYWHNVGGGDGFDVVPDPDDASWLYSMSQGGNLGRRNWETGESWFLKPPALDTNKLRFNWNAAIAQDPFDNNTIYYASQYLHKSNNKGASWQTISPDLTTDDKEIQKKTGETGGLTLDITGAETHNTIITIAPSYKEKGVIWVGTDDGNVQLTRDGGKTWTNFRGKLPGMPAGAWIPQIRTSKHNAGEAFVVVNDYRRGNFTPYIYRTADYGKTWTRMVDDKKVYGYALTVLQDPEEPNLFFVGTENGLWVSFDNGANFEQWKHGYPSVSTYDLVIQEREADLVIGTFGRALWILDDIRPLRHAAKNGFSTAKKITVFEPNDAYQAQYRAATGYDWSNYGLYNGENRSRGAAIAYFIHPSSSANDATKNKATANAQTQRGRNGRNSKDSVVARFYNEQNELIRTLQMNGTEGYNRFFWGMDEKGFRNPGSPKPRPNAPEPRGYDVFPGRYKVVISYGGESDSSYITVKSDPRLGDRKAIKQSQRDLQAGLRKNADKVTEILDRISESEEVVEKIQSQLKGLEGAKIDSLRKAGTATLDSLKTLREFIRGKSDERQGIVRSGDITVLTKIQQAMQYITSKAVTPGEQEMALVQMAEEGIAQAVDKANHFYSGHWKKYQQQVNSTDINLFTDYKPL